MGKNEFRDEMTPKERVTALLTGKPYDRVPVNPCLGEHAARVTGITISQYHFSAVKMAEAQIAAYKTYGHDLLGVGPGLSLIESIGAKVVYPEQSTPFVAEHLINRPSDLERLSPPDPRRDGRLPVFWEALQILINELGEEVPVTVGFRAPFSVAGNLRGAENLLRDLYNDPEFAHRLLRFALDSTIPIIEEAAKLGVTDFGFADPVASGSLISPKHYQEFAFPYAKEIFDVVKRVGGNPPTFHICGNTKKIWQLMADTGASTLRLEDKMDLAEAKQAVGDRITLAGNIRPTETMYLGKPEDVVENVKDCLLKAYDNPKGFILSLGCGLPIDTPPENLHALVGAVRKYGRYPVIPELLV